MPIYYRADTRTPDEIFRIGFSPRNRFCHKDTLNIIDTTKAEWWQEGILKRELYADYVVSEADSDLVISLTTKFSSAPIFPVRFGSGDIYVYIITLSQEAVYDLHSYQAEQARNICSLNKRYNSGFVAMSLCGYEAFTPKIMPDDIICAVKCTRTALLPGTAGLKVYATHDYTDFLVPLDRNFKVGHQVFINQNFDAQNINEKLQEKEIAIEYSKKLTNKEMQTTSVSEAIKEQGLRDPQQDSFFFVSLRNLDIKYAIWSLFNSVYHGIKYLSNKIFNVCFKKPYPNPSLEVITIGKDNENISTAKNSEESLLLQRTPSMLHIQKSAISTNNHDILYDGIILDEGTRKQGSIATPRMQVI